MEKPEQKKAEENENNLNVEASPEIVLPSAQQFSDFYTELTEMNQLLSGYKDGFFVLKAVDTTILVSEKAIVELLSDKLRQPLNITEDMKLRGNPTFIDDIDERIKKKLDWMLAQFGRIFTEMQDIEVKALCEGYHRTLSLPLIAKIRYLEWERLQTSHKIQQATELVEIRKNEEIAQIRREYKDKSEQDQTEARKKIEYLEGKVRSVTETNKSLSSMQRQDQQDIKNLRGEAEDLLEKKKDAEAKASKLEAELHTARSELEIIKERLKQHTGGSDWEEDVVSTPEKPVFINKTAKVILTFPESLTDFKKNFKPVKVTDEEVIYKHGEKEFKLPISLAKKFQDREKPKKPKPSKTKKAMTGDEEKIVQALSESNEPASAMELSGATGQPIKKTYTILDKLVADGVVEEVESGEDDGIKIYTLPD